MLALSILAFRPRSQIARLVAAFRALAAALPNLKRVDYSDAKGLSFTDEHNWRVLFGQPEQTNAKLSMLRTLVELTMVTRFGFAPSTWFRNPPVNCGWFSALLN